MQRKLLFKALTTVGIFAVISGAGCKKQATTPPRTVLAWSQIPEPPANGPSAWSQIRAQMDDNGELDRDGALRAFSLAYGAVDGVTGVPALDRSVPLCGNPILHAVNRHRASLTPAQRAAVDGVFFKPRQRAVAASVVEAWYDDENMGIGERVTHRAKLDQVTTMIRQIANAVEARAGHALRATVKVQLIYNHSAAPACAIGEVELGLGIATPEEFAQPTRNAPFCRIVVNPDWTNNPQTLRMIAAHEYFHCLQFEAFQGTWAEWENLPIWLKEGPAAYAGEAVAGPTTADGYWWQEYFLPANRGGTRATHDGQEFAPGSHYQLYSSGYDAIGFFASLASAGANLWAPRTGGQESRLLGFVNNRTAHNGLAEALSWNPDAPSKIASAASRQSWSPSWDIRDPGLQADLPAPRAREFARQRTPLNMAAMHHTVREGEMALVDATSADKPLVKVTASGAGRVRVGVVEPTFWGPNFEQYFCRTPPCACPNGRPMLVNTINIPIDATFHFSILGTSDASHVSAEAVDYDSVCPPDQPPADLNPCLIGTWRLDPDSFRQSFSAAFPSAQGNVRLDTMVETLTIGANRMMVIDIPQLVASGGTGGARVNVTMRAHFEGRVGTTAQALISTATRPPQASGDFRVTVGRQELAQPLPAEALNMLRAQGTMTGRYTCTMNPRVFVYTPAQGATLRFTQ